MQVGSHGAELRLKKARHGYDWRGFAVFIKAHRLAFYQLDILQPALGWVDFDFSFGDVDLELAIVIKEDTKFRTEVDDVHAFGLYGKPVAGLGHPEPRLAAVHFSR